MLQKVYNKRESGQLGSKGANGPGDHSDDLESFRNPEEGKEVGKKMIERTSTEILHDPSLNMSGNISGIA